MMNEKLVVIKEAELQNNCPECFNQELKLTFYQKHRHGRWSRKVTSDIDHQIKCAKCGSTIYPAKWTDDIERIFGYYQKTVAPENSSTSFTVLFYVILLLILTVIGVLAYLYVDGTISF